MSETLRKEMWTVKLVQASRGKEQWAYEAIKHDWSAEYKTIRVIIEEQRS